METPFRSAAFSLILSHCLLADIVATCSTFIFLEPGQLHGIDDIDHVKGCLVG